LGQRIINLVMKEKVRFESIDLLRGLAIIVMIEVHVFNAFLIPEFRLQGWFQILNFINGLVAPSFLFVSGFAFYISVSNKVDELRKFGDVFYKRIKRIIEILIIGYVLHLPFYSLRDFIQQIDYNSWITFLNVDVLHCIAAGLFFLLLLRIIIKNNRLFIITILIFTLITTVAAPFIWKINFDEFLPMPAANYFNPNNGSLFPIFPWMGFIFTGVIAGKYFIEAQENGKQNILIKRILILGLTFILFGHLLLLGILPESIDSLSPNPIFFILRSGYVLALLSFCWFVTQKKSVKLNFIYDASRESLLIYWLHLQFIYLQLFSGKSLEDIFGHSLGILESALGAIILILIMIVCAKLWGRLKVRSMKTARTINYAFVSVLIIIFIIR
jgi:uncharacterized membrane protein